MKRSKWANKFTLNKGFHSTYQTAKEFGILKK